MSDCCLCSICVVGRVANVISPIWNSEEAEVEKPSDRQPQKSQESSSSNYPSEWKRDDGLSRKIHDA